MGKILEIRQIRQYFAHQNFVPYGISLTALLDKDMPNRHAQQTGYNT